MHKSNYRYSPQTTPKISHSFRCYFAVGDPKGEDFRGDAGTPGCFFAAINSDISKRCSILHASRVAALVGPGRPSNPPDDWLWADARRR
jgi:hypothetical protein